MRKTSVASVLALLLASGYAEIAQAADAPPTASADALDTVVVTGTRQANRTVAESLSPITALSPEALEHSGKLGLQEILADVLPSFILPSQAGGNLSNVIRVAQLRGLNPDQTLVLVNGKRRHPGSIVNIAGTVGIGAQPTDLNLIPPGAIARVEVLTDGAAAQYGSDAIAGVINIILKSNGEGGSLNSQIGQYYRGDGQNEAVDFDSGFKLGSDGFVNLSASYLRQNNTDRAQDATLSPLYYPGDPRNNLPDGKIQYGYGLPLQNIAQIGWNAEKPVGAGLTAYSFGTVSYQRAQQWLGYRAPSNVNNVVAIYPNGFQPINEVRQWDYGLTGGLKSDNIFGGWAMDLSATYGQNFNDVVLYNSVSPTYGLNSPTEFYLGRLVSSQLVSNLDLRHNYNVGFAAPLAVAVGAEYKRDGYQIGAGQVESYARGPYPVLTGPSAGQFTDIPGSQAASGFTPLDASNHYRDSEAVYADLETTVLPKWDIGLAGRYENYSDFGGNLSGKFSTRYQLLSMLAVRGTVSTGFRAPSLGQEFYSTSSTSQYKGVDYKIALVPASSVAAGILGATPLKPETSFNLGGGFVFTPVRNATVTVDAYQIDVDNRIVLSANIGLLPSGALNTTVASLLAAQGIQGVNVGRYFLNGANTRTQGVDIVGNYALDLPRGHLNLTAAFNTGATRILALDNQANQLIYGTVVFNQTSQEQLTKSSPAYKLVVSANYALGPFSLFVRENRFGQYIAPSTVTGGDSYAGPVWTTDLEIRYKINAHVEAGIGAQNLTNVYPAYANPLNFAASTYNGANYYNANSPIGISGGDYYGRLTFKW
jgi:iron complex outermembrane receptor protein